jgi:glycosyltransferase involved in cell wall biosynthesis
MTEPRPRVSFAVPVYNEEHSIGRCLDSLLAQDFGDFEIVVSDNASTDRTREVALAYAARDPRVRLFPSATNVGLIRNFNRALELTRGELFRWVGADDWLEPRYASKSVAALDADPGAIVATTDFALHDERGVARAVEFDGERLESPDPARRFARVLWFFHAGTVRYEPLYALMRREVVAASGRIRNIANNDLMLIAELSLAGRFTHVPELLFHRSWRPPVSRRELLERLAPGGGRSLAGSFLARAGVLLSIVRAAPLGAGARARCRLAVLRACAREARMLATERAHDFRRERLGLTRARVRALFGGNGS